MERKRKKDSGFYIAVCCCAVIIAAVGYANRLSLNEKAPEENEIAQNTGVVSETEKPKLPEVTSAPKSTASPSGGKTDSKKEAAAVANNVRTEEEIRFKSPVQGKVIGEYSGDDLVYNEALKDWRAHSGVDFEADRGEKVICSADGVVEEVFDSGLGRCVIVDHRNGFKTMYASLEENTSVKPGDELACGDVIGSVGDTALGDSTDEPHLHFEMTEKNKNVNPTDYLE